MDAAEQVSVVAEQNPLVQQSYPAKLQAESVVPEGAEQAMDAALQASVGVEHLPSVQQS